MTFKFISRAYIVTTFNDYEKKNRWDNIYRKLYYETKKQESEMELSYDEAMTDVNFVKNRYQNVLPFDQNRVKLKTRKNGETDFINASPLKIPFANRDYILSQGPLDTTSGDFWQMIWEQNTRIIVMLNNVYEKGSMKCFPYFSTEDEKEKTFGDFKIHLDEETGTEIFRIRTMTLTATDPIHIEDGQTNQRTIHHFQFIDWPDFGVPSETESFLDFCQHVSDSEEKLRKEETFSPVVVHCSAGIGRSGAFVVVDSLLNYFQKQKTNHSEINQEIDGNNEIHVPATLEEFVLQIRKYRTGLIQTPEQLRFCWQSLNDWIKSNPDDDEPQQQPAEILPRKRQSTSESIEISLETENKRSKK